MVCDADPSSQWHSHCDLLPGASCNATCNTIIGLSCYGLGRVCAPWHDPADRRGFAALQQRQGHQTSIGFEPGVLKHGLRCMWDETWLQQVFTGDEVNQWNTPTKRPRTGDACARCSHTQVQRGKDLVAAGDHDIETFALMGGSIPPRSSQTRHILI